jgi:hypothetical protein
MAAYRAFENAVERAFPAGVRGADDACLPLGEEDRAAVGRRSAERQSRPVGDQRVGLRPLAGERFAHDDRIRRMDLVKAQEMSGPTPIHSATRRRFSRMRGSSSEPVPVLSPR